MMNESFYCTIHLPPQCALIVIPNGDLVCGQFVGKKKKIEIVAQLEPKTVLYHSPFGMRQFQMSWPLKLFVFAIDIRNIYWRLSCELNRAVLMRIQTKWPSLLRYRVKLWRHLMRSQINMVKLPTTITASFQQQCVNVLFLLSQLNLLDYARSWLTQACNWDAAYICVATEFAAFNSCMNGPSRLIQSRINPSEVLFCLQYWLGKRSFFRISCIRIHIWKDIKPLLFTFHAIYALKAKRNFIRKSHYLSRFIATQILKITKFVHSQADGAICE